MNMITTIINYKRAVPMQKLGFYEIRKLRKAEGLCIQCGGQRPCKPCGQRTKLWRDNRRAK